MKSKLRQAEKTARLVAELAAQLPGTTVLGYALRATEVQFRALVQGREAINSLQFLASSANVGALPWLKHPAPEIEINQVLSASFARLDTLRFGYLQILGIHIIWRLHKLGLMSRAQANPLLRRWRAVEVLAGAEAQNNHVLYG